MAWQTPKTNWAAVDGVAASDMNRIEENTSIIRQANGVLITDAEGHFSASNVEAALHELFVFITQGKSSIASAITTMGQSASSADTFTALASKITSISSDANAAVGEVLTGKTFYQGGVKRTGTMADRGAPTFTPSTSNQSIPAGRYTGGTVQGNANLVAGNIKNGVSIFGVAGNYISPVTEAIGISSGFVSSGSWNWAYNTYGTRVAGSQDSTLRCGGYYINESSAGGSRGLASFNGNAWTALSDMSLPLYRHQLVGTPSNALRFGGIYDSSNSTTTSCSRYNGSSWNTASSLPVPVATHMGLGAPDSCISAGGSPTGGASSGVTDAYQFNGSAWAAIASLLTSGSGNLGIKGCGTTSAGLTQGGGQGIGKSGNTASYTFNGTAWTSVGSSIGRATHAVFGTTSSAISAGGVNSYDPEVPMSASKFNGSSWSVIGYSVLPARMIETDGAGSGSAGIMCGAEGPAGIVVKYYG